MSDEKNDKPPQEKPTVKFDPPPKWAEQMFGRVHEQMQVGFSHVDSRFLEMEERLNEQGGKLDRAIHGLGTVTDEVEKLKADHFQFKGELNARLDSNSMRARAESVTNEAQDEKLEQMKEWIQEVAKNQTAELLKEVAKTPLGRKVLTGAGYALLAAFALATVYLGLLTAKLEAQKSAAPPVIAPPIIYIVPDAGAVK